MWARLLPSWSESKASYFWTTMTKNYQCRNHDTQKMPASACTIDICCEIHIYKTPPASTLLLE